MNKASFNPLQPEGQHAHRQDGKPAARRVEERARAGSRARGKFIVLMALALLVLLLVAWIDGGEEPVHAITETIEVPLKGRS